MHATSRSLACGIEPTKGEAFNVKIMVLSSYRTVLHVQQVSVSLQHVWCSPCNCRLSLRFRFSRITFFRTPPTSTCRSFWLLIVFFFNFFSPLILWSGLFCRLCCVLVAGALALHLLYLDEMRLFGLLCFTVVCDHSRCISLG